MEYVGVFTRLIKEGQIPIDEPLKTLVTCTSDLVTCTSDLVACSSDLVICTSDLVTCSSDQVGIRNTHDLDVIALYKKPI